MIINVIHNPDNRERGSKIAFEISRQRIENAVFRFHPAVYEQKARTGISKAHKAIIRDNIDEPETIIMEDDVKIPSENGIKYFLDNKPDDFDIYLAGIYNGGIKNGLVKNFSGLHLYIVNQRFYEEFLKADENKHLDRALSGKGKFVVCEPFAAIQYNGISENTGKEENYDHYLRGKKIYGL